MFIRNEKRFNIYAPFTDEEGNKYSNLRDPELQEKYGVTEIPDPHRESEETHYVQEIDEAPYVVNTPKPKDALLSKLRQAANARRESVEIGGFEFRGKRFQSDQRSFNRIQAAATAAEMSKTNGLPFTPIPWTAEDNSTLLMDGPTVIEFFLALVQHGAQAHTNATVIKRHLDKLTLEELMVFDLDKAWPLDVTIAENER